MEKNKNHRFLDCSLNEFVNLNPPDQLIDRFIKLKKNKLYIKYLGLQVQLSELQVDFENIKSKIDELNLVIDDIVIHMETDLEEGFELKWMEEIYDE